MICASVRLAARTQLHEFSASSWNELWIALRTQMRAYRAQLERHVDRPSMLGRYLSIAQDTTGPSEAFREFTYILGSTALEKHRRVGRPAQSLISLANKFPDGGVHCEHTVAYI